MVLYFQASRRPWTQVIDGSLGYSTLTVSIPEVSHLGDAMQVCMMDSVVTRYVQQCLGGGMMKILCM
jgi:hypothetical protein